MTQSQALAILKLGNNVYLTGAAGSGKTFVLNQYIQYLKKNNIPVGITASTGIAATHINGMTIHSWSGIGIKDALTDTDIDMLMDKSHLRTRFLNVKVLILDEISMIHAYRLDMIDRLCKAFKYSDKPFGGLQIVMCGDFFQLPPVTRGSEDGSFVYKSEIWNQMDLKICYLEEQHRQSDDSFLSVLNDIRNNDVTEDTMNYLASRFEQEVEGFDTPTKLYTHNIDVDAINLKELDKLHTDVHAHKMSSTGKPDLVETLRKSCLAPEQLLLKEGAVVMFVKNNFESGYVNGTLGTVTGFDSTNFPIVKTVEGKLITAIPESWAIEDEGSVKAQVTQVPLRLAWAITIHKSQGMSLDAAEIDLSKSFLPGMGYVALSRVRTLVGMKLVGFNNMALRVNQEVLEVDKQLKALSLLSEDYLNDLSRETIMKEESDFIKRSTPKQYN